MNFYLREMIAHRVYCTGALCHDAPTTANVIPVTDLGYCYVRRRVTDAPRNGTL
jgi:hypothetical protein